MGWIPWQDPRADPLLFFPLSQARFSNTPRYHNAIVPPVVQRNLFENPAWYTAYTPYSPEQSQGRLESLINFQTVAIQLTGLPIANASLLDESTAAAEGMAMCVASVTKGKFTKGKKVFLVSPSVAPQTIAVLETRAPGFGVDLQIAESNEAFAATVDKLGDKLIGVLVQYPDVDGAIGDWAAIAEKVKGHGAKTVVATDLLALTMLKPPGEWGADIVCGNSQRFGVPLGYGGPHAAFFACTEDMKRKMPGRIVGLSKDSEGNPAYRLALQTREQHIRREKATSNVCTAQALLANMAAMYAVYHGPEGLRKIAGKTHQLTRVLAAQLTQLGFTVQNKSFFDTLTIDVSTAGVTAAQVHETSVAAGINFRRVDQKTVGVTLDESVGPLDLTDIVNVFYRVKGQADIAPAVLDKASRTLSLTAESVTAPIDNALARTTSFLPQPVFNRHHSETDMLRYMMHLQQKDYSLVHGMIPLGSCTMKLNSTSSMVPLSWKEFGGVHPFTPVNQAEGYKVMLDEIERDLSLVTGYDATSVQPNSGASGEFAGLKVIHAYHESLGQGHRDVCLIPLSAHGTNPASAAMIGYKVVPIKALEDGSLDLADLKEKATKHKDNLAAFMVTYPSTFGTFDEGIEEACKIVHDNGGQVYVDGANANALVGLTSLGRVGGDVSHTNLHKTFSIPHGGGGPGVGPISVKKHLAPFLPGHPVVPDVGGEKAIKAVSAAPYGSASINLISWSYIKMLGGEGLTSASKMALLNANYIAERLRPYYSLRFTNKNGRVAHECLLDLAEFEQKAGLRVPDFSKRLQDYSFHPPTAQWPIQTCWLIEPTESEPKHELDRLVDALISIRKEVDEIIAGEQSKDDNVFKNAPHPQSIITADEWTKPYSREKAAYPVANLRRSKFWPTVGRVDDAAGDLNLICECGSVEDFAA
jgi:glycine dehydrogenase